MVDLLYKNNFKIYDWNIDSIDGVIFYVDFSRFIKNVKSDKDIIFLLMYCVYMSKNLVKVFLIIIKYYKDKGYEFKVIDENIFEEFYFMKK